MKDAIDGVHLCKVSDEYFYAKGDGTGHEIVKGALPCSLPDLAPFDLFTHRAIGWGKGFDVSCGRSGTRVAVTGKTRMAAELACIDRIEKEARRTGRIPREGFWMAAAEAIKNYGHSPRYAWRKDMYPQKGGRS